MNDYQNNYLGEAVRHKIKLFTKEIYFNYFNHILIEKSKNFSAFEKINTLSFSIEKLLKEKTKNKYKKIDKTKNSKSLWNLIMLLICNASNQKNVEYSKNEFNLNPICYMYLTNLCQKKLKLLISFSNNHNIPLDTLVKFYLDLCTNQINQKEIDNNIMNENSQKTSKIIDYKKVTQKNKKLNNSKIYEKKNPILGPSQIEYPNSFTRLFIGEIDPVSVRERYLSNIVVKKLKQMHLYNSYTDLSNLYLKRLYKKLFKKDNKGVDKDMMDILNKFKNDTKKVENYQRNASYNDKKNIKSSYYDEDKENLEMQLKRQKNLYMEQKSIEQNKIKKRKNYRFLSLSPTILRNNTKLNSRKSNCINIINNYRNNLINNSKTTRYSSINFPIYKKIRCFSVNTNSRNDIKSNNSHKIGSLNSTINVKKEYRNNSQNYETLFKNDLQVRKDILKKNRNILMKLKRNLDVKNNIFTKRRRIKLKNYLQNEDFFFTKMN